MNPDHLIGATLALIGAVVTVVYTASWLFTAALAAYATTRRVEVGDGADEQGWARLLAAVEAARDDIEADADFQLWEAGR